MVQRRGRVHHLQKNFNEMRLVIGEKTKNYLSAETRVIRCFLNTASVSWCAPEVNFNNCVKKKQTNKSNKVETKQTGKQFSGDQNSEQWIGSPAQWTLSVNIIFAIPTFLFWAEIFFFNFTSSRHSTKQNNCHLILTIRCIYTLWF